MKHSVKLFVAGMALTLGGTSSAAICSNVINNQPTVSQAETSNTITLNKFNNTPKFANVDIKADASSGFDFSGMIVEGIKRGGINLIGMAGATLGKMAFNAILSNIGVDVRSAEQKSLDQIQSKLADLSNSLKEGVSDIKRTVIQAQHKNIMNEILTKLDIIQSPIAAKIATMIDISKKELDSNYDKKELENEKETFYKGLEDMKFAQLGGINLWNDTENLAKSILAPFAPEKSLGLTDLYEDCYGANETWDYMTIAPRIKFISYISTLVNSLAEIALIKANYDMSKLGANDSNILDYTTGLKNMASAVNALNAEFKKELDGLETIQKKHDEQHLITHRDMVVNNDGSITYKEGRTLSTKLFAVTTADNDDNYLSYKHDGKNKAITVDFGLSGKQLVFANFIYTLDCTSNRDLYKTVFNEYNTYKNCLCDDAKKSFTMQDYLIKAGFTCNNTDGFNKAKGFYSRIDCSTRSHAGTLGWSEDTHNDLKAFYYDFKNPQFSETAGEISDVRGQRSTWFSSTKHWYEKGDQADNYYLVFVEPNQKTIGKIAETEIGRVTTPTATTTAYDNHFKGHRTWTDGCNAYVNI